MKFYTLKVLEWIDNNINHGIIEKVVIYLPEGKFSYWIHEHICYNFCNFVYSTLYDKGWDKK